MSVFAVTPLVLAGVVAIGSHALSKPLTSDAATALLKRARIAGAACRNGFSSQRDADKIRFEIDVLKSMLVNVPEDSQAVAEREVDSVAREFARQVQLFQSRKFASEVEEIDRGLEGVRVGDTVVAHEVASLKSRAEALQQVLSNMRIEERSTAGARLVQLFERLNDVEQVRKDIETLNDVEKSLDVENNEHEKARKSGIVSHIIQRLRSSPFATNADVRKAQAVANKILTRQAPKELIGTSDIQSLQGMLTERVWSEEDLKTAKELIRRISQQESAYSQLHRGVADHERLVQTLKPSVLSEQSYASAVRAARSIVSDLKLQSWGQHQATKLLTYMQAIRSQCGRLSNSADKEREVDDVIGNLYTLGAVASQVETRSRRESPSSIDLQIDTIRGRIASYDFLHEVDQLLVDLLADINKVELSRRQGLQASHTDLMRMLKEARSAKTTGKQSKWLLAISTKYFKQNGSLKRQYSNADKNRLKKELELLKRTGHLAGGQHGRVQTLIAKVI